MSESIWAEPRHVASVEDCYFYHTMDIPGHGLVHGEWDLREREASYLGHVELKGKRVLELGTASGHLCFAMERMGAEVVGYDLSDRQEWDIVPFAGVDVREHIARRKEHIRRLNNGFWFAHRAYRSAAKVVYGSVYEIPDGIGTFDVCTLGSILLHLRDPFLALQRATARVRDTVIVTDVISRPGLPAALQALFHGIESVTRIRLMRFLPSAARGAPLDTWWALTPRTIVEMVRVLGFTDTRVTYSRHRHGPREMPMFTVVGRRTGGAPEPADTPRA